MFSRFELEGFAKTAADTYLRGGQPLNDTISKLAREQQFTEHHIDRVAQAANTLVNAALVKKARKEGSDPRVRFDLADGGEIRRSLRGDRQRAVDVAKTAAVTEAFTMPRQPLDRGQVLDSVFGARAADPFAGAPRSVDHGELAETYVKQEKVAAAIASRVTSASIGAALQTLETLYTQARQQTTTDKLAMDAAESDLRDQIHDTLLDGVSPATLRATIKRAGLDQRVAKYVEALVTKTAASLALREGKSALGDEAVVNVSHPLFSKAASVLKIIDKASTSFEGQKKLAKAVDAARRDFRAAASGGR